MTLAGPLQPLQLTCFEYQGRMRSGSTGPLRIVARDAAGKAVNVVLKLRDPGTPEGPAGGHHFGTSLAAELIFAVLARALGLSVPDYGIAIVGSIFASGVSDNTVSHLLLRNLGPNFASVRLTPQLAPWDPDCSLISAELRQAIDDVISFDATVVNGDRKAHNPNLLWNGKDAVHVIDHGMACPVYEWDDPTIARSPLISDRDVQAHCGYKFLQGQQAQFNRVIRQWAAVTTPAFWSSLRGEIPAEWERRRGDLDRIFRFLEARSARGQAITSELRRIVR